jgi:hypothetical protein
LQKQRLGPAAALFKLARTNLRQYASVHEGINLEDVRALMDSWLADLERNNLTMNPLRNDNAPRLAFPSRQLTRGGP